MEGEGRNRFVSFLLNNLLTILLVLGVALGCALGIVIRVTSEPLGDRASTFLGFPGVLLIRMLKCSATPLILACIVVALGSLDLTISKTLGWQLVVYVFATKFASALIGLVMAIVVHPGSAEESDEEEQHEIEGKGTLLDVFLDMFRNIIPPNMMRMYVQQYQTKLKQPAGNETEDDYYKWAIDVRFVDSMNLIGMIFIATVVGLSLTILQQRGQGFLVIAVTVYEVSMKVAIWILWTAPVCLFFLILAEILNIKDFTKFFSTWGIYILTLNASYLLIILVMHPLILFLLARINIFKFYADLVPALVTAFVTASSMATLPVLIECLLKHGIEPRVVRFVVPIGVNVNKDGSAAFMALATVFVAQMTNVEMTMGHYVIVVVVSALGSMATAAVPFGAAIVLVMILNGLGLDQSLIGGILAVEWINDRGQTLTNIAGNGVHPKLLEKWNRKLLSEKGAGDEM